MKTLLFSSLREVAILMARALHTAPPYVTPAGKLCLELNERQYRLYR